MKRLNHSNIKKKKNPKECALKLTEMNGGSL